MLNGLQPWTAKVFEDQVQIDRLNIREKKVPLGEPSMR